MNNDMHHDDMTDHEIAENSSDSDTHIVNTLSENNVVEQQESASALGLSSRRKSTERPVKTPNKWTPRIVYGTLIILPILAVIFVTCLSTSAQTTSTPADDASRDSLMWNAPPQSMSKKWNADGYTSLINTPGATVVTTDNGIYRLDSTDGHRIWSYERPGHLCDAIQSQGNIVAVYNDGTGCSEVINIDASTGKYIHQAEYGTTETTARLVTGSEGRIALVTRSFVRLLRSDLVPSSQFGDSPEPLYANNATYSGCTIYDVAVGPKYFAVSAKCAKDKTTHIRLIDVSPTDVNKADVPVDVDSGSSENDQDRTAGHVTVPVISMSMFTFVVPGKNPAAYTWQLDKDKSEVARENLGPGEYGYGYQDIDGIGYVWRIGSTVHSRSGSEDLSKSVTRDHAIGNPIVAGQDLLIPRSGSIMVWNPVSDKDVREISVPGLQGSRFAFSGKTMVSFDRGTVTGYASDE